MGLAGGTARGKPSFPTQTSSSGQGSLGGRGQQGRKGSLCLTQETMNFPYRQKLSARREALGPRATDGAWAALQLWAAPQGWRPGNASASPRWGLGRRPRNRPVGRLGRRPLAGLRCLVA